MDATGAGDSFCGGLAAGLALGEELAVAAQRGAATAGAALGASGSLRLLRRKAVAERLRACYERGSPPRTRPLPEPGEMDDSDVMEREIATIPAVVRIPAGDGGTSGVNGGRTAAGISTSASSSSWAAGTRSSPARRRPWLSTATPGPGPLGARPRLRPVRGAVPTRSDGGRGRLLLRADGPDDRGGAPGPRLRPSW